ncbi:MAG TPA: hypothetical protein PKD86_07090 [Gemmatales bacterium]|nr:hypothetical protein [Gemmatales bacterium]HMP59101.1 hypothetical protein [Gemmatales bacterium]
MLLFWAATYHLPLTRGQRVRDSLAILVANLVSFLTGLLLADAGYLP